MRILGLKIKIKERKLHPYTNKVFINNKGKGDRYTIKNIRDNGKICTLFKAGVVNNAQYPIDTITSLILEKEFVWE